MDFFVTHTCAIGPDYTNAYYRTRQVIIETEMMINDYGEGDDDT